MKWTGNWSGKIEKAITLRWKVSLRNGWLGTPGLMGNSTGRQRLTGTHAPAGGIYPFHLSTITLFPIKQRHRFQGLPEWSMSEPGRHSQKQAFRNTGTLYCDITLLDGFCSEISRSCVPRGVQRNPVSFWLTKSRDSPQDPFDIFQPQEDDKEETI